MTHLTFNFYQLEIKDYQEDWWVSLVEDWLRICLPMQETWVLSLVQRDPAHHRAMKPVCHNYREFYSPFSTIREATAMRSQHLHAAMRESP